MVLCKWNGCGYVVTFAAISGHAVTFGNDPDHSLALISGRVITFENWFYWRKLGASMIRLLTLKLTVDTIYPLAHECGIGYSDALSYKKS